MTHKIFDTLKKETELDEILTTLNCTDTFYVMWKRENTRLFQNKFKGLDYSTIFLPYHILTNAVRVIADKIV